MVIIRMGAVTNGWCGSSISGGGIEFSAHYPRFLIPKFGNCFCMILHADHQELGEWKSVGDLKGTLRLHNDTMLNVAEATSHVNKLAFAYLDKPSFIHH